MKYWKPMMCLLLVCAFLNQTLFAHDPPPRPAYYDHPTITNAFQDVYNGGTGQTWGYCYYHNVGGQRSLGTIYMPGGGSPTGLLWEAVRPSGATITSGTISQSVTSPSYALGDGAIFRLQTRSLYYGFHHLGPWATSVVWPTGRSGCDGCQGKIKQRIPYCYCVGVLNYPCRLCGYTIERADCTCTCLDAGWFNNQWIKLRIPYYGGHQGYIFTTLSALDIPAFSTVTVKNDSGANVSGMPVYIVDENHGIFSNPEVRSTDSAGQAKYCVPNYVRTVDKQGISILTADDYYYYTNGLLHLRNGTFLVRAGGFHYQSTTFGGNVANGVTKTIVIGPESTVTVKQLGAGVAGKTICVIDADGYMLNDENLTTSSAGKATFNIPRNVDFRYCVIDSNYSVIEVSNLLRSPANADIILLQTNQPALTAPANNASYTVNDTIDFTWNAVTSAASYAWFIQYGSTGFNGYNMGANRSFNGINLGTPGTWSWVVQAYDSSGNVIAQSQIRTINITSASQSVSIPTSPTGMDMAKQDGLTMTKAMALATIQGIPADSEHVEFVPFDEVTENNAQMASLGEKKVKSDVVDRESLIGTKLVEAEENALATKDIERMLEENAKALFNRDKGRVQADALDEMDEFEEYEREFFDSYYGEGAYDYFYGFGDDAAANANHDNCGCKHCLGERLGNNDSRPITPAPLNANSISPAEEKGTWTEEEIDALEMEFWLGEENW